MATVTHRVTTPSTSNTSSYASGSFTPASGDLLVVCVTATATVASGTCSNSAGNTFTRITTALKNSSADTLYLFVANSLVTSATSQTCTFDCTGDAASGAIISVISISGMSRTGSSAVAKSGVQNNGSASVPAVSLGSAANTNNPLIGFVGNGTSPATLTQPSGWTELFDSTGYSSPTTGQEVASINSGFTGSTVTWGSTSGTAFGAIAAEFDISLKAVTGTFAATETGGDTAAATGKVIVKGSGAATEPTKDALAATGKVIVKGSGAANETGNDTSTATGKVVVKGSGAASETGSDSASGAGKLTVKGSMTATEPSTDTSTATGKVLVKGDVAATEASDTSNATGKVLITGSGAAQEVGTDTSTISGKVLIQGLASAVETGVDTLAASGQLIIQGSMAATETGVDVLAAVGSIGGQTVTGSMAAQEVADQWQASGLIKVSGSLAATEGRDVLSANGSTKTTGVFAALEGRDVWSVTGSVLIVGQATLLETNLDVLAAKGPQILPLPPGGIARTRSSLQQSAHRSQSAGLRPVLSTFTRARTCQPSN